MTSINSGNIYLYLYNTIILEYENAAYNNQVNDKYHLRLNEKSPNFVFKLTGSKFKNKSIFHVSPNERK